MSYFQLYEKKRNRYKQVQPGSVWKSNSGSFYIRITSVDLSRGTINGTWNYTTLSGNDKIEWLLRWYHPVKE
jgi:hypothetical protein